MKKSNGNYYIMKITSFYWTTMPNKAIQKHTYQVFVWSIQKTKVNKIKNSKSTERDKVQYCKLWYFHTKKFNWYLNIAISTWITKPYSFEEYETKIRCNFPNGQYMKTKIKSFVLHLSKKLWKKTSTGIRLMN